MNKCVEFVIPDYWITLDDLRAICDQADELFGQPASKMIMSFPTRRAAIRLMAANDVDFGDQPVLMAESDFPENLIRVFCHG